MAAKASGVERHCRLIIFFVLLNVVSNVSSAMQHKVGDLDAWGIPPPGKPELYSIWSQSRDFQIGDSLMFLYPPSQDAVLQVTAAAFESCDVGNPVLRISDGNSLFNITSPGDYLFISGVSGHCEKKQKLRISVKGGNGSSSPAVFAPAQPPSFAPQPATGFGVTAVFWLLLLQFLLV